MFLSEEGISLLARQGSSPGGQGNSNRESPSTTLPVNGTAIQSATVSETSSTSSGSGNHTAIIAVSRNPACFYHVIS